ncbi:hypothetical protein [Moritella marina]|uniref:hypothetical protein n=1 Tax=Moritella marina TaxID=90736 RepID=UPI003703AAE5
MIHKFCLLFIALTLSGCVGLKHSINDANPKRQRSTCRSECRMTGVFLNFTTQNDFADRAVDNLKTQCVGGKISGVFTKHQTTSYLLVFKREVIVSGYCSLPKDIM